MSVQTPHEIAKVCMDSEGYIIFAAVIGKQKDKRGVPMIDMHYRRYHLGFEDASMAIKQFRAELMKDIEGAISDEEGQDGAKQ